MYDRPLWYDTRYEVPSTAQRYLPMCTGPRGNKNSLESMWELIPFRTSPHITQQETARRETDDINIIDENDGLTYVDVP